MKTKPGKEKQKQKYEAPKVLASYEKDELEDAVGLDPEVEGDGGGGCGCGCGCSIP